MEVLNLIKRLFWEWVFPYISRIHTAIGFRTSIFRYQRNVSVIFFATKRREMFGDLVIFLLGPSIENLLKQVPWTRSLRLEDNPPFLLGPFVTFQGRTVKLREGRISPCSSYKGHPIGIRFGFCC